MPTTHKRDALPEAIEAYRDDRWFRTPELRVDTVEQAERFVRSVGFASTLTDCRKTGPSLYIAVCGRRDAHMPRTVQKDPEASLAWVLKDEIMRRGRIYYGKVLKGRATLVVPALVPAFYALFGIAKKDESDKLSEDARAVLKALRREWEMATADLRKDSGIADRTRFGKAIDELQACMKVIPGEVLYVPKFTYIWSLAEGRFAAELKQKMARDRAIVAIARAYLTAMGQTARGELSRVTGLSRPEAGKANHALVDEGFAERRATGVYRLASLASDE